MVKYRKDNLQNQRLWKLWILNILHKLIMFISVWVLKFLESQVLVQASYRVAMLLKKGNLYREWTHRNTEGVNASAVNICYILRALAVWSE